MLATQLIVELAGARWVGHTDVHGELPERPVVRYRPEQADRLIGLETPVEVQHAILGRLGFDVEGERVVVPTWRARDVTREVDVIEEVARFRLEDVPFTLPERSAMFGSLTREQQLRRRIEDTLVGLGFVETYTPSLRPDEETPWKLGEPISVELTALRTRLLPSLLEAARRNAEVGATETALFEIALFEIARVYLPGDELPDERPRVAGIVEGGFARVKGVVETLYAALKADLEVERAEDPLLHPGKAAGTAAGVFGEVHPSLLEGTWSAFELDVNELVRASREPVIYEDVITYPAVKQDLAFAVDEDVPAGELVEVAREAAGAELREIVPFDVYRGEQVGPGRKSIALRVEFRSPERTLTDEEAADLRQKIVDALHERFGADLRA
jgi:phenylalanyl-tRNA synthetase beta chain